MHQSDSLPLDLNAALDDLSWRNGFVWPLTHPEARNLDVGPNQHFLRDILALPDTPTRDVLLLCAPVLWTQGLALTELGLIVQRAERDGIQLKGGPPEGYLLRGQNPPTDLVHTDATVLFTQNITNAPLRRLARTWVMNSPLRFPKAVLSPDFEAISHNSLMVGEAQLSGRSISFRHAVSFLHGAETVAIDGDIYRSALETCGTLAARFSAGHDFETNLMERIEGQFVSLAETVLSRATKLVQFLREQRRVPLNVWGATGGFFPARALRIEARRRGGHVTGFDHGGTSGIVDEAYAHALVELSVTNQFTAPTERLAAALRDSAARFSGIETGCEIVSGRGDPAFRFLDQLPTEPVARSAKPKTLYVTGAFVGRFQRARPRIHDVAKLDWQLRVTGEMAQMPIDLMCQPHPEGAMSGRKHPIAEIANVSTQRFEEVMAWADVMVIDTVLSTTIWKAACQAVPIVLIDIDMANINRVWSDLLNRRFRIIKASYDDANRPLVDPRELEAAILKPQSLEELTAVEECRMLFGG